MNNNTMPAGISGNTMERMPGEVEVSGAIRNGTDAGPASYADVALVSESRVLRTGADGRFRFTGLLPGRYRVIVTQEGRTPETVELEVGEDGSQGIDIPLFEAEPADRPAPRRKEWPWMSVAEWHEKHAAHVERVQRGGLDLVFFGDSLTEQWTTTGIDVWRGWLNTERAASFGIGGDTTQNLLWRIRNGGDWTGLSLKVAVVLIGTNNFGFNKHRPDEVVAGVRAIVDELRRQQPQVQILLLGLLPRTYQADVRVRHLIRRVNQEISLLANHPGIRYLNLESVFLSPGGNTLPSLYTEDELHLSEAGYRAWANAVSPVLREMLGAALAAEVFR